MKHTHLGQHISLLYRYSQIFFNIDLKQYNLGSGQYIFLYYLLKNDGINQEQLSNLLKIDKATTARAVAKLMNEGYVTRKVSIKDHRAYILHSTDKGRQLGKNMEKILDKWNTIMLKDFSEEEKKQLFHLFDRLIENILKASGHK